MKALLLLLILVSCGERSKLIFEMGELEPINVTEELRQSISYAEVNAKVLGPKCIGCHGTDSKFPLDTYEAASSQLKKIKKTSITKRTMPPSLISPLSKEELEYHPT